ncbi:S9 family peptidase [Dyadobacter sp. NIV53]|uniref:alpha/beta hydrolase family protein n=1 Tax=Dyadobacter sp. NIV53 TaxID=2861765 RepID=UPI001E52C633|nr:lipase family protein [Dyadobacter sp. NIV53]
MKKFTPSFYFQKIYILVFGCFLFLTACDSNNTPDPIVENQYLEDDSLIREIPKETILQSATALSPLLPGFVKNGVKAYRITYKTKNTDGNEIIASGAIILPVTDQSVSMISVQHGTITNDESAPSHFNPGSEGASFGSLFGSLGYIIAYPDYIGYGASKGYPHPYEHRASLASASLDMLRAAKEFLKGHAEVKWDEKLYIAGYSEGGYATMSLQKKLKKKLHRNLTFELRAVELVHMTKLPS